MANPDLLNPITRVRVLEDIKSFENVQRKRASLRDYEIYNDRAYQYVYDSLVKQLSKSTADQMPIVSNLNIAKRIVNKEASIYNTPPDRIYADIVESDEQVLNDIYAGCGFDSSFSKADKYFCLRNQSFIQVVPKNQKIHLRVLNAHNIDVIPDENDVEQAYAYIVSSFDKAGLISSDNSNQTTADADDYKSSLERYQVWTKEYTFVMNGKGVVIGEMLPNPIGELPFIDVAKDKDFEFFVRQGQALTDFTVDFNVAWSDLMYIARMQGYSVGILSGDANLKPDNIVVGPNRLLFLPKSAANPDSKLELDFKNPSPNLDASLKAIEGLIATFLSTRGAAVKSIQTSNSGSSSYSSAIERLLAMIEEFEATKEDFDLFKVVEKKTHNIVTKWLALLSGTDQLDREYWTTAGIINSSVTINFHKPEMIETKGEQLDNSQKRIDLGIADKVSVLADIENISLDEAEEKIIEINERKTKLLALQVPVEVNNATQQNENN